MNKTNFINYIERRFEIYSDEFLNGLFLGQQPLASIQQGTVAWDKKRQNIVTCSNLGKALGINPNMSQCKYARILKGMDDDKPNDFAMMMMQHGKDEEPISRNIYLQKRKAGLLNPQNKRVRHAYIMETGTFLSNDENIKFSGSPDGVYFGDDEEGPVLLELKNPFKKVIQEIQEPDLNYYLQMLGLMGLMKIKSGDLVYVKRANNEMVVFKIYFDQEAFDYLNDRINEFISDYEIDKMNEEVPSSVNFNQRVPASTKANHTLFFKRKIEQFTKCIYRGKIKEEEEDFDEEMI